MMMLWFVQRSKRYYGPLHQLRRCLSKRCAFAFWYPGGCTTTTNSVDLVKMDEYGLQRWDHDPCTDKLEKDCLNLGLCISIGREDTRQLWCAGWAGVAGVFWKKLRKIKWCLALTELPAQNPRSPLHTITCKVWQCDEHIILNRSGCINSIQHSKCSHQQRVHDLHQTHFYNVQVEHRSLSQSHCGVLHFSTSRHQRVIDLVN